MKEYSINLNKWIENPYFNLVVDILVLIMCTVELAIGNSDKLLIIILMGYVFDNGASQFTKLKSK